MYVTISERPTEIKGLNRTTSKLKTTAISSTFGGCYNLEKIGKKHLFLVFDRGIEL
jgi:hypothetical protein